MLTDTIPGTNLKYGDNQDAFSVLRPMLDITGGLSLGQICTITGLQPSTIQNWVKRSYVPHPVNKKYEERHLSRILLISALRNSMNIEEIGELMTLINGETDDESDDIISESQLYDYFCQIIMNLQEDNLDKNNIDKVIKKLIKNEIHKDKLLSALRIMVYAYIVGICRNYIDADLNNLRK